MKGRIALLSEGHPWLPHWCRGFRRFKSRLVEVYLDTGHSGTGLKAADLLPDRLPRYIAPPSLEAIQKVLPLMPRGMRRRVAEKSAKNVILWAACRDNQTSADAYFGGSYHGAFTYYWVKEITPANNKISRKDLLTKVNLDLLSNHYLQVAQLESPATQRTIALATPPAAGVAAFPTA